MDNNNSNFTALATIATPRRIIVLVLLLVALIIGYFIIFKGDDFTVTTLDIPASNKSVELINDTLYAYNGMSFYKQSLVDGSEPKVLGGGVKLPVVTRALWAADKGVLLNFDESVINTAVSEVADAKGLLFSEQRSSTWYYDFSTDSLKHVGVYQISNSSHYFNDKTATLSFVSTDSEGTILHSLNTATLTDTQTPLTSVFSDISSVSPCIKTSSTCLTGRIDFDDKSGVYSVTDSGDVKPEYENDGEVYSTPNSPWILTLNRVDDVSSEEDGSIAQYNRMHAVNLKTNKSFTINSTFGPGNFLYAIYDDSEVALIAEGGEKYIRTGTLSGIQKTSQADIKYSTSKTFASAPIISQNPTNQVILFEATDGTLNIFARNGTIQNSDNTPDSDEVGKALRTCSGVDGEVEFNDDTASYGIFLPDDANFKIQVKAVSDCMVDKKLSTSYSYAFTSVDPKTGRPTSY